MEYPSTYGSNIYWVDARGKMGLRKLNKRLARQTPGLFMLTLLMFVSCHQKEPAKPLTSYRYPYGLEELQKNFSAAIIAQAATDMTQLEAVNATGRYKPLFSSLDSHPVPAWYRDAKLGIFLDWGLYSVAGYGEKGWSRARYPDWYLNHMFHEHAAYHSKTWGPDFSRDDFLPLFTAAGFNAHEIVNMVKLSGARYFVPFSKHHDGFCLWDSKYTRRDVADMFPGRDLTAEMVEECRKAGIYQGFYFSVEEYEYPLIIDNDSLCIRYWSKDMAPDNAGIAEQTGEILGKFISEKHNRMLSGKVPVRDFIRELIVPQAREYIDKYDPDILWFDGEWQRPAEYYRTLDLVAYFYNKAEGRKEVVSNDRFGKGTREKHGDFNTSETDEVVEKTDYPWEENRSMSESYGYNQTDSLENYLTADELVEMLIRIVAKGGNLNLIINPDGTGQVPQIQMNLLRELGQWLAINGEAIYGTRPYEVVCDNTQLGQPVWYTMSSDSTYAYAIILDWPKSETFICKGANMVWNTEVRMLGYDKPLQWVDVGKKLWGMSAKIPHVMIGNPAARPCDFAWVLKFRYDKDNRWGN